MVPFSILHYLLLFAIVIIGFSCNTRLKKIIKIKQLINFTYEFHGKKQNFFVIIADENLKKLTNSLTYLKKETSFTKTIEKEFEEIKKLRLLHIEYYGYFKDKENNKMPNVEDRLSEIKLRKVGAGFILKAFFSFKTK